MTGSEPGPWDPRLSPFPWAEPAKDGPGLTARLLARLLARLRPPAGRHHAVPGVPEALPVPVPAGREES